MFQSAITTIYLQNVTDLVGKVWIVGVLQEHGRWDRTLIWLKDIINHVDETIGAFDGISDLGQFGWWLGTMHGK